ncbi:ABC transporter substrate-binding protein [Curtobacterium sp. SP.BCo]|uniref:ABC transporter substrate-binding protein n=1 Tax=Curtobacterium sp. SP.BCo TaxID=3435229 RepID=UPI003F73B80B
MKKTLLAATGGIVVAALALSGCSAGSSNDSGKPSGTITVLTNRTDLVNTTFKDYAKQFEEKYPGTTVKFEALTDYEGDAKIRLNSKDYGDALLIPSSTVTKDKYSAYFEPLGKTSTLEEKYNFVGDGSYDGEVYGLSTFGSAMGMVINKTVWKDAGITTPPKTEDEYFQDLQAIKDKTSAIPYYTNYKDGWPLATLEGNLGTTQGPDVRMKLASENSPWKPGTDQYKIDDLLYQTVEKKLSEPDPTTTNWEESKDLLAQGKIGSMILGSWAVTQMQDAAKKAGKSADEIGFWPMPWQTDGKFTSVTATDKLLAVSKNSDNKATARAWVNWFINDSGYAKSQGAISPVKADPTPDTLSDFKTLGVEYQELNPDPKGKEALLTDIANTAQVDIFGNVYRQKLIDTARGAASGDEESFFANLNKEWAAARTQVSK